MECELCKLAQGNRDRASLGYVAGFLDGDGCIRWTRKYRYLYLTWYNTCRKVLKRIHNTIGCGGLYDNPMLPGRKIVYRLQVGGSKAEIILKKLDQLLVSKGGKPTWSYIAGFFDAEGSLFYQNNRRAWRFQLSNKNNTILEKIKDFAGFGRVHNDKKGIYYHTIDRGLDILTVLNRIKPEVFVKIKSVENFLVWINNPNRHLRRTHLIEKEIVKLYRKNYSSVQIAKIFNLSPEGVLAVLERNKIPRRSLSEATRIWFNKKDVKRDSKGRFV